VFHITEHLYYICVSATGESPEIIHQQLQLLHSQILFSLTKSQLEGVFERQPGFDLRKLLGGTDVLLDCLAKSFKHPDLFLNSFRTMKQSTKLRRGIQRCWATANPGKSALLGFILAKKGLLYIYNPRKQAVHPKDVMLMINLIYSSTTFRAVESWTPVCLPEFNSNGFLYSYSCFFVKDAAMVLLSVDKDAFFDLSQFKRDFVTVACANENLEAQGILPLLEETIRTEPTNVVELGILGLRHFMFRLKASNNFFEFNPLPPYTNSQDRKRLIRGYQQAQRLLAESKGKLQYHVTDDETIVHKVMITNQVSGFFDIYCAFSPLIPKESVAKILLQLKEWIIANQDSFQ
jgi:hypothetical protein